jgi:hypothetical protein
MSSCCLAVVTDYAAIASMHMLLQDQLQPTLLVPISLSMSDIVAAVAVTDAIRLTREVDVDQIKRCSRHATAGVVL